MAVVPPWLVGDNCLCTLNSGRHLTGPCRLIRMKTGIAAHTMVGSSTMSRWALLMTGCGMHDLDAIHPVVQDKMRLLFQWISKFCVKQCNL